MDGEIKKTKNIKEIIFLFILGHFVFGLILFGLLAFGLQMTVEGAVLSYLVVAIVSVPIYDSYSKF